MHGTLYEEQKYNKSFKHYISRLQKAFRKNNKLARKAKRELETALMQKKRSSSDNRRSYSSRKRSRTSTNTSMKSTVARKESEPETEFANGKDLFRCKKQKKTNGKKRRNPPRIQNSLAADQSDKPDVVSTSSECPKKSKSNNKKKRLQKSKKLRLDDIQEHPMLQQELVANIDGSYIQFHLVSIDPKQLLQEPQEITTEPMPSLIWPYN